MQITSSAFTNNQKIPTKYTCDGEGINPPLQFSDIPENSKSLALICNDPDAPSGSFVHWLIFNISPKTNQIGENSPPEEAIQGLTSLGRPGYVGPCPPSGTHRYIFSLYALDIMLEREANTDKSQLEQAMNDHIVEKKELTGLYSRT